MRKTGIKDLAMKLKTALGKKPWKGAVVLLIGGLSTQPVLAEWAPANPPTAWGDSLGRCPTQASAEASCNCVSMDITGHGYHSLSGPAVGAAGLVTRTCSIQYANGAVASFSVTGTYTCPPLGYAWTLSGAAYCPVTGCPSGTQADASSICLPIPADGTCKLR